MSAERAMGGDSIQGRRDRTIDSRLAALAVLLLLVALLALRKVAEDHMTTPVGPVALPPPSQASSSSVRVAATREAVATAAIVADATLGPQATVYARAVTVGRLTAPSPGRQLQETVR